MIQRILFILGVFTLATFTAFTAPIPVLIVDGQNNHDWQGTTPILKRYLEETGLFKVDVATTPPKGGDMSAFKPDFARYKAVVSNYNGEPWSETTRKAFEDFVKAGGGFVPVHAANNSFPDWLEYNRMIGLGGWGGRTEKNGPYVFSKEEQGELIRDTSPGRGGSHGKQHEFTVVLRDTKHPVTAGLPAKWRHAKDELYDRLRGPAENLHVLGTAFSATETGGTGRHEPMLMTLNYGKGRVFHTALGHARAGDHLAMQCVGFIVTFQRGVEWAATGKVTQSVPADFPTEDKISLRQ